MFARLVLVFVVELGTACAPGTPDRASLQRDATSTLRMTDAVELLHFGGDNQMTLDGPIDAWDGYVFGVQVSPEEVFAFYEKELAGLGWRVDPLSTSY